MFWGKICRRVKFILIIIVAIKSRVCDQMTRLEYRILHSIPITLSLISSPVKKCINAAISTVADAGSSLKSPWHFLLWVPISSYCNIPCLSGQMLSSHQVTFNSCIRQARSAMESVASGSSPSKQWRKRWVINTPASLLLWEREGQPWGACSTPSSTIPNRIECSS